MMLRPYFRVLVPPAHELPHWSSRRVSAARTEATGRPSIPLVSASSLATVAGSTCASWASLAFALPDLTSLPRYNMYL